MQITASTSGVMALSKAAAVMSGSNSGAAATRMSAPSAASGRVTALCSYPEITALPPYGTRLLMARFSPWVAFMVNTTCSGSGT